MGHLAERVTPVQEAPAPVDGVDMSGGHRQDFSMTEACIPPTRYATEEELRGLG